MNPSLVDSNCRTPDSTTSTDQVVALPGDFNHAVRFLRNSLQASNVPRRVLIKLVQEVFPFAFGEAADVPTADFPVCSFSPVENSPLRDRWSLSPKADPHTREGQVCEQAWGDQASEKAQSWQREQQQAQKDRPGQRSDQL
eukprot:7582106-Alexandrium_andersonii.AAC.1